MNPDITARAPGRTAADELRAADTLAAGNLPVEPNAFIGRERDLAELASILRRARILTLCGPGGIGKTRLALRLAASLAPGFPDGVWIADLADADAPERLVPLITAALGIRQEPDRPPADILADVLRPRAMLLVLDTCEHLVQQSAELVQRLLGQCPGLRVIATSREPLRVRGEVTWRVPPLHLPPADDVAAAATCEAVRLFVARATAVRPDFRLHTGNIAAVADVCRTLDGVPLAIELAAARTRALSPDQISARLADRFELLAFGDRTAPPRQQTLRAAVVWSYDLLTGPERLLLSRLSVFHGWTLAMAEQVCADDVILAAGVLDLLTALIDKSLVNVDAELHGEGRYRMLDTVREFAAEQATAAGEIAGLRLAHRDCMLVLAQDIAGQALVRGDPPWPDRVAAYQRIRADRANFALALACSVERGDAAAGLRLCQALGGYWLIGGEVVQAAAWLDQLLAIEAPVPVGVRARALAARAALAFEQQDYPGAEQHARASVELCPVGSDGNPARALRLLALTALSTGRPDEALEQAEAAVAAARCMSDDWELGVALASRAAVLASDGKLAEAQRGYEQALGVLADNNGWGVAYVLHGLGQLARARDEAADAVAYFGDALALYRQIDARSQMAKCLAGIGSVALARGDLPTARASLTESMRLSLAAGQRLAIARGLAALAALAIASGTTERAVLLAGAAEALFTAAGATRPAPVFRRIERLTGIAAGRLGADAVEALLAQGRDMSPDQAAALAAAELADQAPPPAADWASQPAAAAGADLASGNVLWPGPLTEREREIALLVARGMSNRAIAGHLVISQATVARHIANIFAKLTVRSRGEVAAWVARSHPGEPG
ncbi:MAG TPA: tetratricopeptide repeat protein [Streptosporangiaceae bacterium]|nr:tetratricopeptide repeat protein [Streptosporangiaceae bacterium]